MATDNNASGNVASQMNSKYISIKPENGETFNAGQKIIYNIEPNIGYIKRDSYLVMDVVNKTTDNGRYCLGMAGAHGLIQQINIYSKETGVLLENLNNYNQWVAIENQYMTDDKTQLGIKEGVRLPCEALEPQLLNNGFFRKSQVPNGKDKTNALLSPIGVGGQALFMEKRYCIPLRCGIFRHWDDEKLIPILNMGGLRIELILADANLALQRLAYTKDDVGHPDGVLPVDMVRQGKTTETRGGASNIFTFSGTTTLDNCGLAVGNQIVIRGEIGGAGGIVNTYRAITAITDDGAGNVSITVDGAQIGTTTNACLIMVNVSVANGNTHGGAGAVEPVYQITNTEYRLCVVAPTGAQAQALTSALNYEFTSYDLFMDNIPTATLRHQVPFHSVASKAKCLMTLLYDSSDERNLAGQSYYTGVQNKADVPASYLNDVVYFINNKLYPLRSYNPLRHADRVLNLNELVKAFNTINKPVLSMGSNVAGRLEDYVNTPLICRELARGEFVFDLRNAEPELRLGFTGARPQNLRANSFVWSKKIISTSSSGVQVIY